MAQKKEFKEALKAEKEAAATAFLSQMGKGEATEKEPETERPASLFAPQEKGGKRQQGRQQRKTDRLNLTISPQDKADLLIMSHIERKAATQIINNLVEAYLEENRPKIEQYKAIFGEDVEHDE